MLSDILRSVSGLCVNMCICVNKSDTNQIRANATVNRQIEFSEALPSVRH